MNESGAITTRMGQRRSLYTQPARERPSPPTRFAPPRGRGPGCGPPAWIPPSRRRLAENPLVHALDGPGGARGGAGRRRHVHVQVRRRARLPVQRPGGLRELPHHERPVRLVAQGSAPRGRHLQRLPRAAALSRQVHRQGAQRLPPLDGLHLPAAARPTSPARRTVFEEPIRIKSKNSQILQDNCLRCHGDFVHDIVRGSTWAEQRHPLRALPLRPSATERDDSERNPWSPAARRPVTGLRRRRRSAAAVGHRGRRPRCWSTSSSASRRRRTPSSSSWRSPRTTSTRRSGASTGRASTTATSRTAEPTHTKYGGGLVGPEGTLPPEKADARSLAHPHLRRLPLRGRLPRPPRPRLHAAGPGGHQAQRARRGEAVGQLPALPRLDHAALPEARRRGAARRPPRPSRCRRASRRSREMSYWDAHKQLAEPDQRRRTRSPASTATTRRRWSCASPGPAFITGIQKLAASRRRGAAPAQHRALAARATARAPTIPTSTARARRCAPSSAASATSSTTAARA